jgi:hypothetical protein
MIHVILRPEDIKELNKQSQSLDMNPLDVLNLHIGVKDKLREQGWDKAPGEFQVAHFELEVAPPDPGTKNKYTVRSFKTNKALRAKNGKVCGCWERLNGAKYLGKDIMGPHYKPLRDYIKQNDPKLYSQLFR